ncbi:hypothetical protein GYH36_14715, partial [Cellulosimicrobium cellulans]|nr:hypothetical protein [Cellulosimicrobium composti]
MPPLDERAPRDPADALLRLGGRLRRGRVSDDLRQVFLTGGRQGDVFYRDR